MFDLLQTKKIKLLPVLVLTVVLALIVFFVVRALSIPPLSGGIPGVSSPTAVVYKGRITYIDPKFYPQEGISYVLTDSSGKEIVLLTAADQKLVVSEGLNVSVYGVLSKTKTGENVLVVDKVVIENASN